MNLGSKDPNQAGGKDPDSPQLSAPARVSDDVTSVALNRPVGAGFASPPAALSSAPLQGLSDAEVMLRVKAGDDAAFDLLVGKFRRPIVNFMYRMVRNQAVAEELAQEVFLRVYRSRESYTVEAKFTTWLYRIATNLGVNWARDSRQERLQGSSLDETDEETGLALDVADGRMTAEQALLRRERMDAIRRHVAALPERQRVAVIMHKYQGMDYKQIGEVLKLSESATKSLLFRAYETLRDKLKDFL